MSIRSRFEVNVSFILRHLKKMNVFFPYFLVKWRMKIEHSTFYSRFFLRHCDVCSTLFVLVSWRLLFWHTFISKAKLKNEDKRFIFLLSIFVCQDAKWIVLIFILWFCTDKNKLKLTSDACLVLLPMLVKGIRLKHELCIIKYYSLEYNLGIFACSFIILYTVFGCHHLKCLPGYHLPGYHFNIIIIDCSSSSVKIVTAYLINRCINNVRVRLVCMLSLSGLYMFTFFVTWITLLWTRLVLVSLVTEGGTNDYIA